MVLRLSGRKPLRRILLPLLAIQNIRLRYFFIARLSQHTLHAVLDIFYVDFIIFHLFLEIRGHP